MKEILLGSEAKVFLTQLSDNNYINNLNLNIKGGIYTEIFKGDPSVYIAFDCSYGETFVEEFDNIVEAAKYANGIMAKTIGGNKI